MYTKTTVVSKRHLKYKNTVGKEAVLRAKNASTKYALPLLLILSVLNNYQPTMEYTHNTDQASVPAVLSTRPRRWLVTCVPFICLFVCLAGVGFP